MSKSNPETSKAMQEAAKQSQSQGISQNQKNAGQQAKQNQQGAAQSSQQLAELGLQVVINTLRAEQERELEKLAKDLAEAEAKVKDLIVRQAGHNIDNLTLQGGDKIKLVTDALKQEAKRTDLNPPPPPAIPQQTASQEQTENNTRGAASDLGNLPDSTDVVAHLTRAAGKMVYAIVGLRDDKLQQPQRLASAYDPHQAAALAALEDALKVVQKQKKDADKKLEDAQKEKIRDAYIKVREDQLAIDKLTTDIDSSARLPDGSLKREQALALNQLPGAQQKLIDKLKELGEDLAALGAIEFNKKVVPTMK